MKRKRHTEEQIIAILKEHEAGTKMADLCRKHGISEGCFYTRGRNVLVASRVRTLLPGGGEPAMVADRLHCQKDDDEQVPTHLICPDWPKVLLNARS